MKQNVAAGPSHLLPFVYCGTPIGTLLGQFSEPDVRVIARVRRVCFLQQVGGLRVAPT